MEMDEAERENRRRRRRSVRNLRRTSGILPPFNLDTEEENAGTSEGIVPDQASSAPDVYGSLWFDSLEPVNTKKRKKRQSQLFSGLASRQLSPLRDDGCQEKPTSVAGNNDCLTGTQQHDDNYTRVSEVSHLKQKQEAGFDSTLSTTDAASSELTHRYSKTAESGFSDPDRNKLDNENKIDFNINNPVPSFVKSPKHTSMEDEQLFSSGNYVVTPGNNSDVSLSRVSPSSMSPDYPMSPGYLESLPLPFDSPVLTSDSVVSRRSDSFIGSFGRHSDIANISNPSCDKENSLNKARLSITENDNGVESSGELNSHKSSPGFFSMCKSFAGKVVEFVKTSPSLITAMPLAELNSSANGQGSPLNGKNDTTLNELSSPYLSGTLTVLIQNSNNTSKDNQEQCESDLVINNNPDITNSKEMFYEGSLGKTVAPEEKPACVSTDSSEQMSTNPETCLSPQKQNWSSFHRTFDAMMSVLQQSSTKKKRTDCNISGASNSDNNAATDVIFNNDDSNDKAGNSASASDIETQVGAEKLDVNVTDLNRSYSANVSKKSMISATSVTSYVLSVENLEDIRNDDAFEFSGTANSLCKVSKLKKSKRRAFGIGEECNEEGEEQTISDSCDVKNDFTEELAQCKSKILTGSKKLSSSVCTKDEIFIAEENRKADERKTKARKRRSFSLQTAPSIADTGGIRLENIDKVNSENAIEMEPVKKVQRKRRSFNLNEAPSLSDGIELDVDCVNTGNSVKSRKRHQVKSDEELSVVGTEVVEEPGQQMSVDIVKRKRGRPPKSVQNNAFNNSSSPELKLNLLPEGSSKIRYRRKSTGLNQLTILGQANSSLPLEDNCCVNELTDNISQVNLTGEEEELNEVQSGEGSAKKPSVTRLKNLPNCRTESTMEYLMFDSPEATTGEKSAKTPKHKLDDSVKFVDQNSESGAYLSQITEEIAHLQCSDSTLVLDSDLSFDNNDEADAQKDRRRRRRSADSTTLKIQMMLSETQSPEVDSPSTSKQVKRRKTAPTMSMEELEKLYRNKNFVRPEKKPWTTIYESPQNDAVFGKKRVLRLVEENPTQLRLRRRMQKAMKNGWDPKKRRKQVLDDDYVRSKLDAVYAELGSSGGNETLENKLRSIIETT